MDENVKKEGIALRIAKWLFLLFVFSLPFERPLDFRYAGIHILASDFIFLTSFLFWLAALLRREVSLTFSKFHFFAGLFAAAMTLSAFFSTELTKSLFKLTGVYYLIAIALVFACLANQLSFVRKVVIAWLLASAVTVIFAAVGVIGFYVGFDSTTSNYFLFHYGSLPAGSYPRVRSLFENANMMCNYLTVSAIFAVAAAHVGWVSKRIALILVAGILIAAVFTISAGLGGIALGMGVWFAVVSNKKQWSYPALAAALVLAVLFFCSTLISPLTRENSSTVVLPIVEKRVELSSRVLLWQNAIELGREYPVLGRGTGTDTTRLRYVVVSGQQQTLRDAHQAWLNIFGQAGLVGLIAFVALCGYLVSICRFRLGENTVRDRLILACSAAFVGSFLYQNLFGSFEDARHLWLLIGLLVGSAANGDRTEENGLV